MHGFATSPHKGKERTRTLNRNVFNNPPTGGGRIGCALFRDFAPHGQGANPNLKPQVCPHWLRACRWPLVCLRRVFEKTLNPFAGDWVVKGWDFFDEYINASISRCPHVSHEEQRPTRLNEVKFHPAPLRASPTLLR